MDRLLNVVALLSVLLILSVLMLVRRSHIRVEYSVSWLGAALVMLLLSLSPAASQWLAYLLGLSSPAVALLVVIGLLFILVFYRFSVLLSELKDANIALTQRVAILEYQLNEAKHSSSEEQET